MEDEGREVGRPTSTLTLFHQKRQTQMEKNRAFSPWKSSSSHLFVNIYTISKIINNNNMKKVYI